MKTKPIRVVGDVAYIPLTKGFEAVIDSSDIHLVENKSWRANVKNHTVYAISSDKRVGGSRPTIIMHRVIANTPDGMDTDHVDGNGLNNKRSNLRNSTRSENLCNTSAKPNNSSGFKGVSWEKRYNRWRALIKKNGKSYHLGLYKTPEDAFMAYCKAAIVFHGDFARTK